MKTLAKREWKGMSQWTDSRCHTLDHQMMRRQGNKKYQRERRVEQWDRKTENSFKKMVLDKGCKGGGWIKGKMLLEQKEKLLTSKECIKKSGAVQHYIKGKSWGQSKKKKEKEKNTEKKRKFISRNLNGKTKFLYVEGIDWMCICNIPPVLFSKG